MFSERTLVWEADDKVKYRASGLRRLTGQTERSNLSLFIYKPVIVLGVIATLSASIYGVQRQIDSKAYSTPLSEHLLLSFPSGSYLKSATFGFDVLVADLIWAHTVVSLGEHLVKNQRTPDSQARWKGYNSLYHLLDITTTLDPLFYEAYQFGSILLAMQEKQVDESMMLLERGIKNFPDDWRLHFIMGFNLTYYKDDTVTAVKHFERAAKLPGHPIYLPRLIGNLYAETGKVDMALAFLEEAYKQFTDEKMRAEIEAKIRELLVQKHTAMLD